MVSLYRSVSRIEKVPSGKAWPPSSFAAMVGQSWDGSLGSICVSGWPIVDTRRGRERLYAEGGNHMVTEYASICSACRQSMSASK